MKNRPESAPGGLSAALRRYLYFTAGVAGGAVMIVEILGAKMLAPYFGTSHFVWTAQIAVTLLALACGYYFGGWLVDRSARLERVYVCLLLAAVYLAFTVPTCEKVAHAALGASLPVGTILASLFLFFPPLTLLATVVPFLVRAMAGSLQGLGGHVGRLSALSTLGSVVGTALIGYALIPFFPNSVTMSLTAALLVVVAGGFFAIWARRASMPTAVLVVAGTVAAVGGIATDRLAGRSTDELYRGNSNFGLLQVVEYRNRNYRLYLNDYLIQNTYDPVEKRSSSMFTYLLAGLARAYTEKVEDVLCIGMGVGVVPMDFARAGARVDVVEINPAVVPVARKYFDFEPEKVTLYFADGRYFLHHPPRRYDAVILDAFLGDSSPSHLMSQEAFAAIKAALKPEGVLVINTLADFGRERGFLVASLERTLASVFRSVRIHASGPGNVFFVASDQPELKVRHELDLEQVHPLVREKAGRVFAGVVKLPAGQGRVLTDDYNPVEFYDAASREELRRQLTRQMREM